MYIFIFICFWGVQNFCKQLYMYIYHHYCFQLLLGITIVPREIESLVMQNFGRLTRYIMVYLKMVNSKGERSRLQKSFEGIFSETVQALYSPFLNKTELFLLYMFYLVVIYVFITQARDFFLVAESLLYFILDYLSSLLLLLVYKRQRV